MTSQVRKSATRRGLQGNRPARAGSRRRRYGLWGKSSSTGHLIFDCWAQIAELTAAIPLDPGDVIFTGTPDGVCRAETAVTCIV